MATAFPLPWRRQTPLHHTLGSRSMRFVYPAGAGMPLTATPASINLRYDASTGIDRIQGVTLSIANGGATACDFTVKELNTGWFWNYSYPGGIGAFAINNIETMPDEVNLNFWFTAQLAGSVYVSFMNIEKVPVLIA